VACPIGLDTFFARSSYAIIKAGLVEGWTRIGTKRIADDLIEISRGQCEKLQKYESLLLGNEFGVQDEE
jgi:hypothetical protein